MSDFADDPDFAPLPPMAQSLPVRLLRAHGVTEQQWRVLCTVSDLRETEITVLAERVFLLPPSLSRILRDLEGRGLLLRRASVQDQRRALISVTAEGEALIGQVGPALLDVRLEIRRLYGIERLRALADMLDGIEATLGPGAPDVVGD